MRVLKSHALASPVNSYLIDSPQPSNLSYLWNFGSLLGLCLVIQIITGVTLAMHYNPSTLEAFNSVEHIMRDVNNGWLIRYLHSNTASAFFFLVYLHIGRGMYYCSYKAPRTLVWTIGTVILIVMMATAFLGYVLPYGQMSLWGATVITNLMSAIPWVGQDIVEFIWGGFSVNNATLNRFFALHFVLPFVIAALVLMHLIAFHENAGSGNPLGISANSDRLPFAPYYIFKDLITIFLFFIVISLFVFFMPNVLGDSENYVMANPMQTPPAIVPEWYLLPFYAILRSIPNKLLGVIAMFSAILALLTLPFTDFGRSRGLQFRPLSKLAFYIFVANFLILMQLGAKHVESPYIEFGQISTALYFGHFIIIMPVVSLIENSLINVNFKAIENRNFSFKPTLQPKQLSIMFTWGKLTRILVIFIIGLLLRFIIVSYLHINVFEDYDHYVSWLFYFFMAYIGVSYDEIVSILSSYNLKDLFIRKYPCKLSMKGVNIRDITRFFIRDDCKMTMGDVNYPDTNPNKDKYILKSERSDPMKVPNILNPAPGSPAPGSSAPVSTTSGNTGSSSSAAVASGSGSSSSAAIASGSGSNTSAAVASGSQQAGSNTSTISNPADYQMSNPDCINLKRHIENAPTVFNNENDLGYYWNGFFNILKENGAKQNRISWNYRHYESECIVQQTANGPVAIPKNDTDISRSSAKTYNSCLRRESGLFPKDEVRVLGLLSEEKLKDTICPGCHGKGKPLNNLEDRARGFARPKR